MWGSRSYYFGDSISVGVRDLQRSIEWYEEKLKLRLTPFHSEDYDALLSFEQEAEVGLALVLIPPGETTATVEKHPILFAPKIEKAHQEFSARGIKVGPIQSDSGGNHFFEFYDLDGNKIEVCVEP